MLAGGVANAGAVVRVGDHVLRPATVESPRIHALLRHVRSAGFVPPTTGLWTTELADPAGGPVMCHNDVCLENVVFRDGRAVALLDFEFAAPGRPVFDLAHFARMCIPLDHPEDAAFTEMWNAMGGQARYDRRHTWFAANRERFLGTLGVSGGGAA